MKRGDMSGQGKRQNQPAKKQSKWSPQENAVVIELRGAGMKWDDVSKRLPGRSPISCRLHYQNYLERRSEWDEERKDKLARLYERFKAEMWAKVAEELAVPWRAAEAMHWQLGEEEIAKRAGVVPFSLNPETSQRTSLGRGHTHTQSQGSVPRDMTLSPPRHVYGASHHHNSMGVHRESVSIAPPTAPQQYRSAPAPPPPPPPPHGPAPSGPPSVTATPVPAPQPLGPPSGEFHYQLGHGLPPIQAHPNPRVPGPLPGVAELTTGVSPYATPPAGPAQQPPPAPPPPNMHHAIHQQPQMYADQEPNPLKRAASPDMRVHESNYRRRMT